MIWRSLFCGSGAGGGAEDAAGRTGGLKEGGAADSATGGTHGAAQYSQVTAPGKAKTSLSAPQVPQSKVKRWQSWALALLAPLEAEEEWERMRLARSRLNPGNRPA